MLSLAKGSIPVTDEEIKAAVRAFTEETDIHGDKEGFYTQTMLSVHNFVYNNGGDFWIWEEDGKLLGYMLGRVVIDIDNSLTYWLSQTWVHPSKRGKKEVKAIWQTIRQQAKNYLCKHIVVVSARGTDAYCRFLGKGYHEYARLLKEDI